MGTTYCSNLESRFLLASWWGSGFLVPEEKKGHFIKVLIANTEKVHGAMYIAHAVDIDLSPVYPINLGKHKFDRETEHHRDLDTSRTRSGRPKDLVTAIVSDKW